VKKIAKVRQKIMLDIGCGHNKQRGYTGMDKRKVSGVDIVHDAEIIPYPLESNSCAVIIMIHLIEHIKPWLQIDVINECWRLLEPDGALILAMPYGNGFRYVQDPTHCSPWNEATVEYYLPGFPLYEVYAPKPWHLEKRFWTHNGDMEVALRKITEKEAKKRRKNSGNLNPDK